MKANFIKLIVIISTITLFSIIGGIVIYSFNYIENNPEKYIPMQKKL